MQSKYLAMLAQFPSLPITKQSLAAHKAAREYREW